MNPASTEFIPKGAESGRPATAANHEEFGRGRGRGRGASNRGGAGERDNTRGRGGRGGRGRDGLPHGVNPQNEDEAEQASYGRGRGNRRGGANSN